MFCFKCGKQIRDDAVFCQYCGAKQNNTSSISVRQSNTVSSSNSSGELDRDALKIYLGNILSLECIKANYERKTSNLRYNIQQIRDNNYYKKYLLRTGKYGRKCYTHLKYDGKTFYVAYTSNNGPYLDEYLEKGEYLWPCFKGEEDLVWLKKVSQWDRAVNFTDNFIARRMQAEEARDAFLKAFSAFQAEAPGIYQENTRKISNLQYQLNGMSKELETVKKLLKQAYDINIVPSQFRYKIHAIYYLHDFISTSRESFTTALLHLDLDEIKAKLDKIIAQQESIIIQNAVMIAQNEKLAKQNQQQLERLSRIESNTSQAAQYAQIAANNAETCAWISMANYIEAHR